MSFLGTFLLAIAKVVNMIVTIYTFIVAGSVIISWVRPDPHNAIVRFLHMATEPVFARCRRFMPAFLYRTGIDWTPMIVIILLVFLETILVGSLTDLGLRLRQGNATSFP